MNGKTHSIRSFLPRVRLYKRESYYYSTKPIENHREYIDDQEEQNSSQWSWRGSILSTNPCISSFTAEYPFPIQLLNPKIASNLISKLVKIICILYILNQINLLPHFLSALISRTMFWPTLPITLSRRIGKWSNTIVDDVVIMGGAPVGFLNIPERLSKEYGVKGVINMCAEYKGPLRKYKKLGIKQLWLPTTDHYEPSLNDMKRAVKFIKSFRDKSKGKVYIHCKAGHGRSAAIVFVWLLSNLNLDTNSSILMERLNIYLCMLRNVRKNLWKQPNINEFKSFIYDQYSVEDKKK